MRSTRSVIVLAFWCCTPGGIADAQVRNPALYEDVSKGSVDQLALYLSAGGDPNAELAVPFGESSMRLLELAARAKNEPAALLLLSSGARTSQPQLIAEIAAQNSFRELLTVLVERDPGLIQKLSPDSHPLIYAIGNADEELAAQILKWVLRYDSQPKVQAILNAALIAAINVPVGRDVVGQLIAAGANLNDTFALAGAAMACNPTLVQQFLEAGADVKQTYEGRSVLDYGSECIDTVPEEVAIQVVTPIIRADPSSCGELERVRRDGSAPLFALLCQR